MNLTQRRAVFLDRDGVLNDAIILGGKPFPPGRLEDLRISRDAPESLSLLDEAGFLLIGVTNQPDVARGTQRREVVEAINREILCRLPLVDILTCYHDNSDDCECRKPRPGLLTLAADRHGIDLAHSYLIGDRWKDVEAGRRAGCTAILVGDGYGEMAGHSAPDHTELYLRDAVRWILASARSRDANGGLNGITVRS